MLVMSLDKLADNCFQVDDSGGGACYSATLSSRANQTSTASGQDVLVGATVRPGHGESIMMSPPHDARTNHHE